MESILRPDSGEGDPSGGHKYRNGGLGCPRAGCKLRSSCGGLASVSSFVCTIKLTSKSLIFGFLLLRIGALLACELGEAVLDDAG